MPGPLDLIPRNENIVTSRAPQSSVTPEQIAAPYRQFAQNLDKIGGVVDEVAVHLAHEAAQDAVTRDESGNLQIQKMPLLIGRASQEYARVAQQGYLAQLDPEISTKVNEARIRFEGKPEEFKTWSQSYIEQLRSTQPTPELRNAVVGVATRYSGETYNGLIARQSQRDIAASSQSLQARQTQLENELTALALQGDTTSDAVKGRITDWEGLHRERVANPLYGYSADQSQYDQTQFLSKLQANATISVVKTVYKDQSADPETGAARGGLENAVAAAKRAILENPALNLTDDQRWGLYHKATAEIRALEAERKQDLAIAKSAANDAMLSAARGVEIGPELQQQIEDNLKKAGGMSEAARFSASLVRARQIDSFNKLPLTEMPKVIGWFASGAGAKASPEAQAAIKEAAEKTGISVAYLFRTAGKESSFNPNATGEGTSAGGLFQFTDGTWADQLARNGAKYGLLPNTPKTDVRASALMAAELAKENAAALKSAGLPVSEGTMYLAHFAGAEGAKKLLAADRNAPAASILPGAAAAEGNKPIFFDKDGQPRTVGGVINRLWDGFGGPEGKVIAEAGADTRMVSEMQRAAGKRAWSAWGVVEKDIDKGIRPADGVIAPIIAAAKIAGDHDLLETIGARMERFGAAAEVGRQPLTVQSSLVTGLQSAATAGTLSPGNAALLQDLITRQKAVTEGLEKNPVATTLSNFPDHFKPVGPIDFSSEGSLAGDLAARAAIVQFARNNYGTGPLSVLDQQDVRDLQAAMATPQGGRVLTTMAGALKPEELQKVFEDKSLVSTLTGMQSNLDQAKMSAANQVVDRIWRTNPAQAEVLLGPKAIEKLQTWQGLKDTFSPEELAKMLNRADDPAIAEARKEAIKAAGAETDKLAAGDIAYRLGSGIPVLNSLTFNVSGATPALPRDSLQAGSLLSDYKAAYSALRANGLDQDKASEQAIQRLRSSWGISAASGNRLMKNAPEMYYPAIAGSHDWIEQDLKAWVAGKVGPEFSTSRRSLEGGIGTAGAERNWTIEGLISDDITQTQIASGRPSYGVAVRRADGTLALLGVQKGNPNDPRIAFDPTDHIERYGAGLERRRREIEINRWAHGGDRGDFVNTGRQWQTSDRPNYLFGEALPE